MSFPGLAASLTYGLLRLTAAVAGSLTLGSLVYTLFCTAPTEGRVDVDGYAGVQSGRAGRDRSWALASLALIPVAAARRRGRDGRRHVPGTRHSTN